MKDPVIKEISQQLSQMQFSLEHCDRYQGNYSRIYANVQPIEADKINLIIVCEAKGGFDVEWQEMPPIHLKNNTATIFSEVNIHKGHYRFLGIPQADYSLEITKENKVIKVTFGLPPERLAANTEVLSALERNWINRAVTATQLINWFHQHREDEVTLTELLQNLNLKYSKGDQAFDEDLKNFDSLSDADKILVVAHFLVEEKLLTQGQRQPMLERLATEQYKPSLIPGLYGLILYMHYFRKIPHICLGTSTAHDYKLYIALSKPYLFLHIYYKDTIDKKIKLKLFPEGETKVYTLKEGYLQLQLEPEDQTRLAIELTAVKE